MGITTNVCKITVRVSEEVRVKYFRTLDVWNNKLEEYYEELYDIYRYNGEIKDIAKDIYGQLIYMGLTDDDLVVSLELLSKNIATKLFNIITNDRYTSEMKVGDTIAIPYTSEVDGLFDDSGNYTGYNGGITIGGTEREYLDSFGIDKVLTVYLNYQVTNFNPEGFYLNIKYLKEDDEDGLVYEDDPLKIEDSQFSVLSGIKGTLPKYTENTNSGIYIDHASKKLMVDGKEVLDMTDLLNMKEAISSIYGLSLDDSIKQQMLSPVQDTYHKEYSRVASIVLDKLLNMK